MSLFYFNWFKMCLTKNPPTATIDHLNNALGQGKLTQKEYDQLLPLIESNPPA